MPNWSYLSFYLSVTFITIKRKHQNTTLHWKKITARKPIKNWIMHQRFLWLSKIPTHSQPILISQKALIYPSSWFFIILITKPVIKFTVKLKDHSWNTYATIEGGRVKRKLYKFIWEGKEDYLPVGTCYLCFYEIEVF